MRIVITTTQVPLMMGGAEYHAKGLKAVLEAHGHEVDIVAVPFHGETPERSPMSF